MSNTFTASVIVFRSDGGQYFESLMPQGFPGQPGTAEYLFTTRSEAWRAAHVHRQVFEEQQDGYDRSPYTDASRMLGYLRGGVEEDIDWLMLESDQHIRGGLIRGRFYARSKGGTMTRTAALVPSPLELLDVSFDHDNPANGQFVRYTIASFEGE
jgi:hypothetical protein